MSKLFIVKSSVLSVFIILIQVINGLDNDGVSDHFNPLLNARILDNNEDSNVIPEYIKLNIAKLLNRGPFQGFPGTEMYLPNTALNISADCKRDVTVINYILSSILGEQYQTPHLENGRRDTRSLYHDNNMWPLFLIDSWGKSQDGFFYGNWEYLGFIDECFEVIAQKTPEFPFDVDFYGKYCKMNSMPIPTGKEITDLDDLEDYLLQNEGHYRKKTINYGPRMMMPPAHVAGNLEVDYGTCIPSTCTDRDIAMSVNTHLIPLGQFLVSVECQTKDQKLDMDGSEIAGVTVFSVIGLLLLIATCAECYCIFTPETTFNKGAGRFLLAFSIWSNTKKIFSYEGSKKQISCVHGIRVLSLCWVIWGHQYMQNFDINVNFMSLDSITRPVIAQTVMNADKSVDSFFVLSGLFVSLGVLNQLKKTGKFNIIMYYVHRFIRLVPGLAFACAYTASITTLFASGPRKYDYIYYIEHGCRRLWFLDVFFASNLVVGDRTNYLNTDGTPLQGTYIGQSWYTSADMQMFIFMPFVILPLYYWRKLGVILLTLWTVISILIRGILVWAYDMKGTGTWADEGNADNFMILYGTPWTRMCSYLVGAWTGYIIYKYQDKNVKLTKFQVCLGWTVSFTCMVLVLYGIYPYNKTPVQPMPLSTTILYEMFQRAVWSAGLGWIVIACHWGYGGFVNWLLSIPAFQPLSRLSFTMFLMAFPMQVLWKMSQKRNIYFSHYNSFQQTAGIIVLVLPLALCLSLIAEGPIINLERMLLRPADKNGQKKSHPIYGTPLLVEKEREIEPSTTTAKERSSRKLAIREQSGGVKPCCHNQKL